MGLEPGAARLDGDEGEPTPDEPTKRTGARAIGTWLVRTISHSSGRSDAGTR